VVGNLPMAADLLARLLGNGTAMPGTTSQRSWRRKQERDRIRHYESGW